MIYLKWLVFFLPNLLIEIGAMILAPVVAMFITKAERTDRVKRLGNTQVTLLRDYLIKPLYWFQTHDNAVDEYWYGCFNEDSIVKYLREATQDQYDKSKVLRWACRVMWLWRNCAYGFSYNLFGVPLDETLYTKEYGTEDKGLWYKLIKRKSSFQFKCNIPTPWKWYYSINIGWKTHNGFQKAMYADRIIGSKATK